MGQSLMVFNMNSIKCNPITLWGTREGNTGYKLYWKRLRNISRLVMQYYFHVICLLPQEDQKAQQGGIYLLGSLMVERRGDGNLKSICVCERERVAWFTDLRLVCRWRNQKLDPWLNKWKSARECNFGIMACDSAGFLIGTSYGRDTKNTVNYILNCVGAGRCIEGKGRE